MAEQSHEQNIETLTVLHLVSDHTGDLTAPERTALGVYMNQLAKLIFDQEIHRKTRP